MPTTTTPSADEQRRAAARRQIEADAEFEQQQAAKRSTQASITPGIDTSAPARPAAAPAPAAPATPSAPTISGAASALRGRGIESMEKRYNFAKGTAYVEGPPGRDKVKAQLTRGEAVLPTETVKAIGTQNIADLIERTSGHKPQRKLHRGKRGAPQVKAFFGYTPEQLEEQRRAGIAYGDASTKAAQNRPDITTPHFMPVNEAFKATASQRGNYSDGTMDAGANATVIAPPARMADQSPREQPNVPVPVARASAGQPPTAPGAVTAPGRSYMEQYYPETRRNFMESGPAIDQAYQQGGIPAAAGMVARKAVGYVPAVASDVMGNVAGAIDPFANALKTAVTGDATPINQTPPVPTAATVGTSGANYGSEGRRPTYAQTGRGATTAPPGTTPASIDSALPPNSARMGGKTRTYTPEQLASYSGQPNAEKGRSPMEIYANEMLLNEAAKTGAAGASIGDGRFEMYGHSGNAPPSWDKAAWKRIAMRQAIEEPFRNRAAIGAREDKATQAGALSQFVGAQQGADMRGVQTEAARQSLNAQQELLNLRRQISSATDPKDQRRLIAAYRALSGQKDMQAPIAVKGGQAVGPDNMTVFAQPESVYDPNIGSYVQNPLAAPPAARTATKAQLQQLMKEGGMDEAAATAYIKQHGYSVI